MLHVVADKLPDRVNCSPDEPRADTLANLAYRDSDQGSNNACANNTTYEPNCSTFGQSHCNANRSPNQCANVAYCLTNNAKEVPMYIWPVPERRHVC